MKKMCFYGWMLLLLTLGLASSAQADPNADPNDYAADLVSHWQLDESFGLLAHDSTGFFNADQRGGADDDSQWVAGRFGGALDFNGTSEFLGLGIGSLYDYGNFSDITLSFWVRFDELDGVQYLFCNNWDYKATIVLVNDNLRVQFLNEIGNPGSGADMRNSPGLVTGQWYHMALVARNTGTDQCNFELYLDGELLMTSPSIPRDNTDRMSWVSFGANAANIDGQNFLDGQMDDIRIYSRALTETEMANLYAFKTTSALPSNDQLAMHWALDETVGYTAVDNRGSTDATLNPAQYADDTSHWVDGKFDGAIDVNGTTNTVIMADRYALSPFQNKTLSMWLAPRVVNQTDIVWSMRPGDGYNFKLYLLLKAGTFGMNFNEGAVYSPVIVSAPADPANPEWVHVALNTYNTDDGTSTWELYVNGILQATKTGVARHVGTWYGATLGAHAGDAATPSNHYDGLIDDVRLYAVPLSSDQIAALAGQEPPASTLDPRQDLAIYWPFDETTGTTVHDDAAPNLDAMIVNSADTTSHWVSGVYDNGIWLDGTDDYIDFPAGRNYDMLLGRMRNRTVSFWFNPDVLGGARFLMSTRPDGQGSNKIYLLLNGNTIQAKFSSFGSTDNQIAATTTVTPGNWYHVALVIRDTIDDECRYELYVNGVREAFHPASPVDTGIEAYDITFGAHAGSIGGSSFFAGTLDDLRIYMRPLWPSEVAAAYAYGALIYGDADLDGDDDMGDFNILSGQWQDSSVTLPGVTTVMENGDFEAYADQTALEAKWQDNGEAAAAGATTSSTVALLTSGAHTGSQAMRWSYDNQDTSGNNINFTELVYAFDQAVDLSCYDYLSLWMYRHPGNSTAEGLYIKFLNHGTDAEDAVAIAAMSKLNGSTSSPAGVWDEWLIDLHHLGYTNPDKATSHEELTSIQALYIGCFTPGAGAGGAGVIDIDDMTLIQAPLCDGSLLGDLDGDCDVDNDDLLIMTNDWLETNN